MRKLAFKKVSGVAEAEDVAAGTLQKGKNYIFVKRGGAPWSSDQIARVHKALLKVVGAGAPFFCLQDDEELEVYEIESEGLVSSDEFRSALLTRQRSGHGVTCPKAKGGKSCDCGYEEAASLLGRAASW